jgi:hypothetical protein
MTRIEITARSVIITRNIEQAPNYRCKVWINVTESSLGRVFRLVAEKNIRTEKGPGSNTKWYLPSKADTPAARPQAGEAK